jgi:hypothetical protein
VLVFTPPLPAPQPPIRPHQICVGVKTTAFPTVYQSVADPIKGLLQGRRRKRAVTALHRVSAVLEPNKLYLVLGGPKSGKTSLLKTIAGALGLLGGMDPCRGILCNGRMNETIRPPPRSPTLIDPPFDTYTYTHIYLCQAASANRDAAWTSRGR